MASPEAHDGARLLDALKTIPDKIEAYGDWWKTDEGIWLLEAIRTRIGEPVTSHVHRYYGVEYDTRDVANTAVVALSNPVVRSKISKATDPWAYLYVALRRKMVRSAGNFFRVELDAGDRRFFYEDTTSSNQPQIVDAIQDTLDCLLPLTPPSLRQPVIDCVYYFAERGHARLSHLFTRSSKDNALLSLGLTREQILAVGNIVIGARPDHGRTSILAGYLKDADWSPYQSDPHRNALRKYSERLEKSVKTPTAKTKVKHA